MKIRVGKTVIETIISISMVSRAIQIFYALVGFGFGLLFPFATKLITDGIVSGNISHTWALFLFVAVASIFIHAYILYFVKYKNQMFANSLTIAHSNKIAEKIGSSSPYAYDGVSKSKVLNLLNMDLHVYYTLTDYLIYTPVNIIKISVILGVLFYINYVIAFIVMLLMPVYAMSSYLNKSKLERLTNEEAARADAYVQDMETIVNFKTALGLASAFLYIFRRFGKSMDEYFAVRNKKHLILLITQELPQMITAVSPVLVFVVGSYFVSNGAMTFGELIFAFQIVALLFQPLTEIACTRADILSKAPIFKRFTDFIDIKEDEAVYESALENCEAFLDIKNAVLRRSDGSELFRIGRLNIKNSGVYVISGENGSGKTTLLNSLIGVFPPELLECEGKRNYFGDKDSIGYLYAHNFLFHGSIRENVTCGEACDEQKLLNLVEMLGMPELEKQVVTRPENLSLGERQKVFLARLLLREKRVMILDEPNSNLDARAMKNLHDYVLKNKNDVAFVIISHDGVFDDIADEHYSIRGGELIEVLHQRSE